MAEDRSPEIGSEEQAIRAWHAKAYDAWSSGHSRQSMMWDDIRTLLSLLDTSRAASAALREELEHERELHRMQLVAITTAALSNTRSTAAANIIQRDHPYWTAVYHDVLSAVAREMEHREQVAALSADLARREQEIANLKAVTTWPPVDGRHELASGPSPSEGTTP